MRDWLQARQAGLLPCDYYHLVATVPQELRHLFLSDQKFMYSLFMKTVAGAVIGLARDRKYLGATPGILMVLHTWTGQMQYHPHVHLLVTGGGVSDGSSWWRRPRPSCRQALRPMDFSRRLRDAKSHIHCARGEPEPAPLTARKPRAPTTTDIVKREELTADLG